MAETSFAPTQLYNEQSDIECRNLYCALVSEEECLSAAQTLGYDIDSVQTQNVPDRPVGCWVRPSGNVVFNTGNGSTSTVSRTLLCGGCPTLDDTTTTASDSTMPETTTTTMTVTNPVFPSTAMAETSFAPTKLYNEQSDIECRNLYCALVSEEECLSAAQALGYDIDSVQTQNVPDRPVGCWVRPSGNVVFNTGNGSTSTVSRTLLCGGCPTLDDTTTTASDSTMLETTTTTMTVTNPVFPSTAMAETSFAPTELYNEQSDIECRNLYCALVSEEECLSAAQALGYDIDSVQTQNVPDRPVGCWVRPSGNVVFNAGNGSTSTVSRTLLCGGCPTLDDTTTAALDSTSNTLPNTTSTSTTIAKTTSDAKVASDFVSRSSPAVTVSMASQTSQHRNDSSTNVTTPPPFLQGELVLTDSVIVYFSIGAVVFFLILVLIFCCCCRCCFANSNCVHCCMRTNPECGFCCRNISNNPCMRRLCCLSEATDLLWAAYEKDDDDNDDDDDPDKKVTPVGDGPEHDSALEMVTLRPPGVAKNTPILSPPSNSSPDFGPGSVVFDIVVPPGELGAFFVPGSIYVGGFFSSSPARRRLDMRQGDRVIAIDGIDVEQLRFQEFLHLVYGSRFQHRRDMTLVRGGYGPPVYAMHEAYDNTGAVLASVGTGAMLFETLHVPIAHGPLRMTFFEAAQPGVFIIAELHFLEPDGTARHLSRAEQPNVQARDILVAICGLGVGGREDKAVQSMLLQSNEQTHRFLTIKRPRPHVSPRRLPSPTDSVVANLEQSGRWMSTPAIQQKSPGTAISLDDKWHSTNKSNAPVLPPPNVPSELFVGVFIASLTVDVAVMAVSPRSNSSRQFPLLRVKFQKSFGSNIVREHFSRGKNLAGSGEQTRIKSRKNGRSRQQTGIPSTSVASSALSTPRLDANSSHATPMWGNGTGDRTVTNLAAQLVTTSDESFSLWLRALCENRRDTGMRMRKELWVRPYARLRQPSLQAAAFEVLPHALKSIRSTVRDCVKEVLSQTSDNNGRQSSRVHRTGLQRMKVVTPLKSGATLANGRHGVSSSTHCIAFGTSEVVFQRTRGLHKRDRPGRVIRDYFPTHAGVCSDHLCAALDATIGADHSDYSDPDFWIDSKNPKHSNGKSKNSDNVQTLFVLIWNFGFTSAAGYRVDRARGEVQQLSSFSLAQGRLDIVGRVFHYVKSRIEGQIRASEAEFTLVDDSEWEEIRASVQLQLRDWTNRIVAARKARKVNGTPEPVRRRSMGGAPLIGGMDELNLTTLTTASALSPDSRKRAYDGWEFHVSLRSGHHFAVPLSLEKYTELNDIAFDTIVDGVAQAYTRSDFKTAAAAPVVMIVGSKKPRVPLLLSRVVSKLHKIHKNTFVPSAQPRRGNTRSARKKSKSEPFRMVNAKRDCLARGAAIFSYLSRQLRRTEEATADARRRANMMRQRENNNRSAAPRVRHLQSLDDEVVTTGTSNRRRVYQSSIQTPRKVESDKDANVINSSATKWELRWAKSFVSLPTCDAE